MSMVKQSFISNLIGNNTYDSCLKYAKPIVSIGTCVLVFLYVLSNFFHLSIISYLINLTNGLSLLFIAFVVEIILLLDIRVDVEEPEREIWGKLENNPTPVSYKFTIVWGVLLILFGITAIYFSNKYREHYAFECDTFWVDKQAHIYHIDWTECEAAECSESLEEMRGYQIGEGFSLCKECKEIVEDAVD